ncbi:carbohydrate ABC transporter permease [Salinarimonas soli]|uniref:Sugar ABC transporter permease n=1 Tax=Salinarimonas soli TaxID=1638099 RepID=A0A5B2VZW0_9HYPH|nr:sugar ABC transporter permease [Salinarimonas soli]KAA2244238.1 sugar ABC transporter permease [Salinarimonas soli]
MKARTFALFIAPSVVLMILFIALPLASVLVQSFYNTRQVFEVVQVENCTPGFLTSVCTTEERSRPKLDAAGRPVLETTFVGLDTYRLLLQPEAVAQALSAGGGGLPALFNLDFYRALRFTLTFTLLTGPFVIGIGLAVALAVNGIVRSLRGPVIFIMLLPFIITPVIGALSIRWLFIGDGILTVALEWLLGRDLSLFAEGWTLEILMMLYRVWHVAPFAFVVFYAGLQTVDQDTLESAIVDGASRFERLRYVVVPHLMPLIVFVTLINLMDSYRVFEEVIGFSSQAHRISLQYLTYSYLTPDETGNRAISRASASSMLTMIGIVFILIPLLVRTWRDHRVTR